MGKDYKDEIEKACKAVTDVQLFDIYRGEQIGSGKKSMAFNVVFTPREEAFTTEMIEGYVNKILKSLENAYGVSLRA